MCGPFRDEIENLPVRFAAIAGSIQRLAEFQMDMTAAVQRTEFRDQCPRLQEIGFQRQRNDPDAGALGQFKSDRIETFGQKFPLPGRLRKDQHGTALLQRAG